MDKRTIIAVVLSVVIISASFLVQSIFFPTTMPNAAPAAPAPSSSRTGVGVGDASATPASPTAPAAAPAQAAGEAVSAAAETAVEETVTVSTAVFEAAFSSRGGVLTSLRFKQFTERDRSLVEMVVSGESAVSPFRLLLDDYDTGADIYRRERVAMPNQVVFARDYVYREAGEEIPFTVRKSYLFKPGDHVFEFRVGIDTADGRRIPVDEYGFSVGPQSGPRYEKLDGRTDYRRMIYYADGKRKDFTGKVRNERREVTDRAGWVAVESKYFLVAAIAYVSDVGSYEVGFDGTPLAGLPDRKQNSIYYTRDIGRNNRIDEGYKFYVGPMKREVLERYNDREKNEWRESGLHLEMATPSSFWGWLSDALKWLLEMFYRLIPNWGVAIILLTLFIKIVFYPLTRKSTESTSKMQALGPKLQEIKERYKDNPQKVNQETAALYKKEGVNPLGGCLPMLLQLPIFFALYRLFSTYFELRGAAFIDPWISDLSGPEQLLTLPFAIPFLGNELHLLPFLMLGMTFLQQLVTQTPGTQTSSQNKMLLYGMPMFFFFIMYNMPSGLLLYWTMQSLIGVAQQFYINRMRRQTPGGTGEKKR